MANFPKDEHKKPASSLSAPIGFALILAAELFRAVRFSFEERLIKKDQMATQFLLICYPALRAKT
jgi:hypothetical protein